MDPTAYVMSGYCGFVGSEQSSPTVFTSTVPFRHGEGRFDECSASQMQRRASQLAVLAAVPSTLMDMESAGPPVQCRVDSVASRNMYTNQWEVRTLHERSVQE